ncbi:MAG: TIGR00282 family metallophosphoesterase [bacterium]
MIGDIVGKPGRKIIKNRLADISKSHKINKVIANGENSAGGLSITPDVASELFDCGVDVITTGNHVWNNKSINDMLDNEPRLLRPANYPEGAPGSGIFTFSNMSPKISVMNLQGRVEMQPIDCPFRKFDQLYNNLDDKNDIIIVDFHAEASSEKKAFGWYLDGRASAVCGTHTHVQTADNEILPGGTAYISDIGMTGSFNSVIGMNKEKSIDNFLNQTRIRFEVATGDNRINGVILTFSLEGKTLGIERLVVK